MWGFSLLMSDSRTGFRKNSSAPSSRHLIQIVKKNGSEMFPVFVKHDTLAIRIQIHDITSCGFIFTVTLLCFDI
jgi:hypothetical protein